MKKNYLFILIGLILIVAIIVTISIIHNRNDSYDLKIHFFNAGKADSIIISKDDNYIMIDTGEESLSSEIINYFKNNNITKLDYLIITHFDKDHVGSAANVINNIEVKNVLQSNVPKESEYYTNYLSALSNKDINPITIANDYDISISDLKIVVNGPTEVYDNDESNNSSLITSIVYNDTSFLFTGDAENARLKDYISTNQNTYNFIKIPYHGNYIKRLDDLFENTKPQYAVITSSDDEKEDEKTITLLDEYSIKYYLTREGSINVLSNGKEIKINQN